MDIRNCKRCNKIFNYEGFSYCRTCRKDMDDEFDRVKKYLRKYPGASISEVEEETGVDSDTIMGYVRDGRLEMDPSSTIEIYCEKCNARIFTGRYCNNCSKELSDSLTEMARSMKKEEVKSSVYSKRKGDDLLMQRGGRGTKE